MYLNTSFAIVVLSTLEEHHHEEMPGFSTKENYHWTAQQEKVPQSFIIEETMMLGCSQMSSMSAKSFFSVENSLNPIGPDCGPILGDPHEEHADPGGVEVVQPRQRKWKPALPSAGDLLPT